VGQLALFESPRATAVYFASGSNRPGEIRGFDEAGINVGVAAPEVTSEGEAELRRVRGLVFVDSGAFSEVDFTERGPVLARPMAPEAWEAVFALYDRLAALGARAFLVAPDRIGDQAVTLELCGRWAGRIRALRDRGVRWIVPIQRGALSMADFERALAGVLGFDDFIRGVPSRKNATPRHELVRFLAEAQPRAVHLLGLGPTSPEYGDRVALCVRAGAEVFCDSVAVRALSGRTNGRGGGPRALTSAQDEAREGLAAERWSGTDGMVPLDYTDAISDPEAWLLPTERRRVVAELGDVCGVAIESDEDLGAWLQTSDDGEGPWRYEHPLVGAVLDAAWARHHERETKPEIKRRAVLRVFGDERRVA
jgi:hypothetical protein